LLLPKAVFFKIDKTYPAGSKFVQAVQNSLMRDLFTLGIRNISGELVTINGLNIKMAFYYSFPSKNVVLNQTFDGTPGDGAIYRWTDGAFSDVGTLPATIQSYIGGEEVLLADQLLYTNKKYHDWSISDSVENFQRIKIGGTTDSLISRFSEVTNNVTLKNYFSSKNQYMNTPISFKDPWLIDYADPAYGNNMRNRGMDAPFKQRTSPFSPDTSYNGDVYQGVFLNQSGAPEWNPPYYSVNANQTQTTSEHGESVSWHFQNWSGTDVTFQNAGAAETPLVFNAAGATAEAVYKGHLVSNQSRASGYNNGRRVYHGFNGKSYMVYGDNKAIYFSSSEDGIIWSQEVKISAPNENCYNPALAAPHPFSIHVVWYNNSDHEIKHRVYDASMDSWSVTETVATVDFYSNAYPRPSIAVTELEKVFVAVDPQKSSSGSAREVSCYYQAQEGGAWSNILGPFNGKNPSVSEYSGEVGLVWENNNNIYFKKRAESGSWSSTVQVNPNVPYIWSESKPSLSYSAGVAHIVWQGMEEDQIAEIEVSNGYHRTYNTANNSLGSLQTISSDGDKDYVNLSVSTVSGNGNDYTIFYEADGMIKKLAKTGSSISETGYGSGRYANITDKGRDLALWTKYTSAPYILKPLYNSGGFSKLAGSAGDDSSRSVSLHKRFSFDLDGAFIAVELTGSRVNSAEALYEQEQSSSNSLYFSGEDDIRLSWKVSYLDIPEGFDTSGELLSVWLVQGDKRSLLKAYSIADFGDPENRRVIDDLVYFAREDKNARLEIDFGDRPALVSNLLQAEKENASFAKSSFESVSEVTPERYYLNANYPNPFNPITHIAFGLPQSAPVRLEVFNLSGQRVALLVDKTLAAGRYDVAFDGSGLASGAYIYRLRAGRAFVQSRKLLLVK